VGQKQRSKVGRISKEREWRRKKYRMKEGKEGGEELVVP
jgi:hypothetical protein